MSPTAPRFLMCPPDHYEVAYAINDWMDPEEWARDAAGWKEAAKTQWEGLKAAITRAGGDVAVIDPVAGLPDMTFTANCAVVFDGKAQMGRFRYPERQPETAHFAKWLGDSKYGGGLTVLPLPDGMTLEGAGDCVWDAARDLFWAGFGPRSSRAAHRVVEETFGQKVVSLELTSNRFYHMDVCLMPLSGGELLYLPEAFTEAGWEEIRARAGGPDRLIEANAVDARGFAVNCVNIGREIILADCSEALEKTLQGRGYHVTRVDLSAFLMGGGGAFCMTLRLDQ